MKLATVPAAWIGIPLCADVAYGLTQTITGHPRGLAHGSGSLIGLAHLAITLAWARSLLSVATTSTGTPITGIQNLSFIGAITCLVATSLLNVLGLRVPNLAEIPLDRLSSANVVLISMPLAGIAFFFSALWTSGAALVRVENRDPTNQFNWKVGTFLALLYLFVGVWFLRRRVQRLLERSAQPDHAE